MKLLPIYNIIWNSIKFVFDESIIDWSKLNRQLEIFTNWTKNKATGYVEAATGFGKTMIAIIAIKRMNYKNPSKKTIVVVPNLNLKEDWIDSNVGHINVFKLKNVEVFVINSFTMRAEDHYCDLLVLDECHRYAQERSEYFSEALNICNYKYVLALSATLSKQEKDFIESYGISRIGHVTLEEAESKGWVSTYEIYNISVPLNQIDLERKDELDNSHNYYYKKFGFDYGLADCCGAGNDKMVKHFKSGRVKTGKRWREDYAREMGWTPDKGMNHEWSPNSIRRYAGLWFKFMTERKTFLHESSDKLNIAEKIIKHLNLKTILFSEKIMIPEELQSRLGNRKAKCYHSQLKTKIYNNDEEIGEGSSNRKYKLYEDQYDYTWKEVKAKYPNAERYSPKDLKQKIKEDFRNNKFKFLLTAKALDEGFDVNDIECGIIHSGSSVKRVNLQRMGRVLRSNGDKKALIINIYVEDSQDEKWVNKRQIGTPKSKINWVKNVEEIKIKENEITNFVLTQ